MLNKEDEELLRIMSLPVAEFNKQISKATLTEDGKIKSRLAGDKYALLTNPPQVNGVSMQEANANLQAPVDEIVQAEIEEQQEQKKASVVSDPVTPENVISSYLNKRSRITFDMENGTYTVPVIDVKECGYGVMIILPAGVNDVMFAPKPGAEVNIHYGQYHWTCFSPGTVFDVPELGIAVISMVKRSGDNEN